MSWNIKTPGDFINGPLTVAGSAAITGALTVGTTLGVTGQLSTANVLKATGNPGLGAAGATEAFLAHNTGYGAIIYGQGTTCDVALLDRNTALRLSVTTSGAQVNGVLTMDGESSVFNNSPLRLGSNQAGGATLLYNGDGNLDITPRSGFHTKLVNGNLIIGTSGKGIDFSATAGTGTSELLNDYEEGTWVGTLIGGTTNPAVLVAATGKYTKIGRQVTVAIYFFNADTTGYAGAVSIQGLPFTEDGTRAVGTAAFFNFDFNGGTGPFVDISGATMFFQTQLTNSNWRDINHTAGVGRYLRATLTYFV